MGTWLYGLPSGHEMVTVVSLFRYMPGLRKLDNQGLKGSVASGSSKSHIKSGVLVIGDDAQLIPLHHCPPLSARHYHLNPLIYC